MMHLLSPPITPDVNLDALRTGCAACSLHPWCLPVGLDAAAFDRIDRLIGRRRQVARGASLYRIGDQLSSLYAIRRGHFKTYQINPGGEAQVTGFPMPGELLGMDGGGTERHQCDAQALEDSEVCEIPFVGMQQLQAEMPVLLRHFQRVMGREITREQSVMLLLGTMRASQRFAAFIVNLAARYEARGYSGTRFQLRMSREEIGNYLGLTIESVSRLLSKFKKAGLLQVRRREVEVRDPGRLKAIAAGTEACS